MAIIVFFLPSLGLFNILNHWKAEQIPFSVRLEAVEDNNMTSGDIIQLNGMTRSVPWKTIDRWEYEQIWTMGLQTDLMDHQPPNNSLYSGLDFGLTLVVFLVLMAVHLVVITLVKIKTVQNIKKENWFNIFVHNLENVNFPFPFKDWDWDTDSTAVEYKQKLREVNIEMAWSFALNMFFNVSMFIPFWWTGIE